MNIVLLSKNSLGRWAAVLSLAYLLMIWLKIQYDFPLSTWLIALFGLAGFVAAIFSLLKGDWAVLTLLAISVGILIILWMIAELVVAWGLFKEFPVKNSLTEKETDYVRTDTVNLAIISESNGWIYYVYEGHLYKRKNDWTERSQISDQPVASLVVVGDWIYYKDVEDGGTLNKMKIDGTEQTNLSLDHIASLAVSGDWIYYNTNKSSQEINTIKANRMVYNDTKDLSKEELGELLGNEAIYRIRTDGSGREKLVDTGWDSGSLYVFDNHLYNVENGNLFRMKVDGTERGLQYENCWTMYEIGGQIYYTLNQTFGDTVSQRISLYRTSPDGTDATHIMTLDDITYYAFDGDWFYYGLEDEKGLYRIKLDGNQNEKCNNINIWRLLGVSGNWMYIADSEGPSFRVKLDGSVGTKLH